MNINSFTSNPLMFNNIDQYLQQMEREPLEDLKNNKTKLSNSLGDSLLR